MDIHIPITVIRALIIAVLCVGACACASWPTETKVEEGSWLALHAIDGAQTARIASTPGLVESESAWLIGREPSQGATVSYFVGVAVLHIAVTDFLIAHHANRWVVRGWEAVTIGDAAKCTIGNFELGLEP